MNRIDARFSSLGQRGATALIPYLTAGVPEPDWTPAIMHALVEAGADAIELGMPFSDPMADGPVIQQACARALAAGVDLDRVLAMVAAFRADDPDTPVILMGYLNPLEQAGFDPFADRAAAAGVDGLLLVDLPPEESAGEAGTTADGRLALIRLVSPTTPTDRMTTIVSSAAGFVYYVALKGVTGASNLDADAVESRLAPLRRTTELPVCVGFGISGPADAARVAAFADGVVVGSALVRELMMQTDRSRAVAGARRVLTPLREALDRV